MKLIIIGAVLAMLVLLAINQQVYAVSAFMKGRQQANSDFFTGQRYNDFCTFNEGPGFCIGYKAGYAFEWAQLHLLH